MSAFDEWKKLMEEGSDQKVIAAMTGTKDHANWMRQSAPYAGLLTPGPYERTCGGKISNICC